MIRSEATFLLPFLLLGTGKDLAKECSSQIERTFSIPVSELGCTELFAWPYKRIALFSQLFRLFRWVLFLKNVNRNGKSLTEEDFSIQGISRIYLFFVHNEIIFNLVSRKRCRYFLSYHFTLVWFQEILRRKTNFCSQIIYYILFYVTFLKIRRKF